MSKIWRVGTFGTALRFAGLRNLVASPELSIKCRHLCQWSSSYPCNKSQRNAAPIQRHSNITSFARTHCKSEIRLQEIGHLQHLRFIMIYHLIAYQMFPIHRENPPPLSVWQKKILVATCSSTSPLVRRHRRVPHSNASPKPTPTSPQWSVGSVGEESTVKTQRLRSGPWDDRFEAWIWDKKKEATQKMTKTKRTKWSQSFSGHKVKVEILNKNR